MHTKTLIVVSSMVLLATLALVAISARMEVGPKTDIKTENTPDISETITPDPLDEAADERRVITSEVETEVLVSDEKFSGELEEVNVGCFADGECYVVVDGKHVTVMMGWANATVGKVLGVEGFGDLESHIGEKVSVYAGKKADGTYTLYQNADYFVSLESETKVKVQN